MAIVLTQGSIIKTGANSQATIDVIGANESATVEMNPNSQLMFAQLAENKEKQTQTTLLDLSLGKI